MRTNYLRHLANIIDIQWSRPVVGGGIFDNCIILAEPLALNSDDLQFAYKSGCSTTQCVSVLCETIDYYVNNEIDVYMCSIDASMQGF